MTLLIVRVSVLVVWTKELNWGWRKLQYDSIIGEEGIADDVNKLKENVLKMGDNQVKGDRKDLVEDNQKGESNDKGCGERH